MFVRSPVVAIAAFAASLTFVVSSPAQQPSRLTLEVLRRAEEYGEALSRIDAWEKQGDLPDELRQVLDFERGETLLAQAIRPEMMGRESLLDEALVQFRRFVEKRPDHALAFDARERIGNVFVELARAHVDAAKRATDDTQREKYFRDGRSAYDQATKEYSRLVEAVKRAGQRPGPPMPAKRDELRQKYVSLQLALPLVLHERAHTFTNAAQRQTALSAAADAYGRVAEKYRTLAIGLYARLNKGRCYEDMEKWAEALELYSDLLESLPEKHDGFRPLRTKALAQSARCWISPSLAKHEFAIKYGEEWLAKQRPNEERDEDWLELRLNVAQAYRQRMLSKDSWTDEARREAKLKAIEYANTAATNSTRLREEAKKFLAELDKQ